MSPDAWRAVKPDGYEEWFAMKEDSQLGWGWHSFQDCEVVCRILNERDEERSKVRSLEEVLLLLPLSKFREGGEGADAADFKDNAHAFVSAMDAARAALAKALWEDAP